MDLLSQYILRTLFNFRCQTRLWLKIRVLVGRGGRQFRRRDARRGSRGRPGPSQCSLSGPPAHPDAHGLRGPPPQARHVSLKSSRSKWNVFLSST